MNALFAFGLLALFFGLLVLVVNRAIWWSLKQGRSPVYCVIFSTLMLVSVYIFTLLIAKLAFHQNVLATWQQEFETSLQATVTMYVGLGVDEAEVMRSAGMLRILFLQGAAGWILVFTLGLSLASYAIQRRIAPHLQGAQIPVPRFNHWCLSEKTIWYLMGALICNLAGSHGIRWLSWAGLNGLIVLGTVYFVIGLAVVMFFFEKRNVSRFFKALALVLIVFFPALIIFVTLIGIFDTWWDWRKVRATSLRNDE